MITRGTKLAFHVSQAVWTPNKEVIEKWTLNSSPAKPSLYRWTELQYQPNGPFDKWLKTVETCRSNYESSQYANVKCCENPSGIGNIIIRDFPTPEFGSAVINKNFIPVSGDQRECEDWLSSIEPQEEVIDSPDFFDSQDGVVELYDVCMTDPTYYLCWIYE